MERWVSEKSVWITVPKSESPSLPAKNVLGVTRPDFVLVWVVTRVRAGARGATSNHVEAHLRQPVKGLLQEIILQVIPRRVSLWESVGISALVQSLPENFFGERRFAAHSDSRHPSKFGVLLDVSSYGVGAPVPDGYVAGFFRVQSERWARAGAGDTRGGERSLLRVALAHLLGDRVLFTDRRSQASRQLLKLKIFCLFKKARLLFEVIGQNQSLVPQVIQNISEQKAVPVQKEASFAVGGKFRGFLLTEHGPEQRIGHGE